MASLFADPRLAAPPYTDNVLYHAIGAVGPRPWFKAWMFNGWQRDRAARGLPVSVRRADVAVYRAGAELGIERLGWGTYLVNHVEGRNSAPKTSG